MMKKLILCLLTALALLAPTTSYGQPPTQKEVSDWTKAAEKGDSESQFNVGLMYAKGDGVEQDYSEAARWFRMSALQGNASSQFVLGMMYSNGDGVRQDYTEASGRAGSGHVYADVHTHADVRTYARTYDHGMF